MSRKTVDVETVKRLVNHGLQSNLSSVKDLTPEQAYRQGLATLVEIVLHQTGNYKGFQYQASEFVADSDEIPGNTVLLPDYDDTKRKYF